MKYRAWLSALVALFACSSDPAPAPPDPCGGLQSFRFPSGGDGHPDPFGAKAAGQARAGKITNPGQIVQGPLARHKVRVGDFALANDKIALYIEAENRAEGYAPFGGDIVGIEPVGDDGRPRGLSAYGETLLALSRQTIKPDKVSVLADGSDGKAAIVRVSGVLTNIPFLDTFAALSPDEYGFPAAFDYILEPGSPKVLLKLHLANTRAELVDFGNVQRIGFFHASRSKLFTEGDGYASPQQPKPWIAYDSGETGFAFRSPTQPMIREIEISGFQLYSVRNLTTEACETKSTDWLEITSGGPGIDGTLLRIREAFGGEERRELRGTVREAGGSPLPGAMVHATSPTGAYLTRAVTDQTGEFVLHLPPGPALVTATLKGWAVPPAIAANVNGPQTITLPARATITVNASDATTGEALPSRIQVIPTTVPVAAPASFGLREELEGRLWQEYTMTGTATLPVPPGPHRVIVSRGYEYEIVDTTVTPGQETPATVDAKLAHSVDSAGVMCADFHVHSWFSADSSDPVEDKVKGAVADGLDIPVSSEHEWVIDFQPVVQRLGVTRWAFGMPSSELTTFSWGHFGVVPIYPHEDAPNNGAVTWVGKKPAEFFQQVNDLPEKPVLIVNHPSGGGFSAYFDAAGFTRATASGDPSLWSEAFGALEVFNDSDFEANRDRSVGDWFALLNAGKTTWAVGSSDSHDQRSTFVGYPRTCLAIGHDDPTRLTPEIVRDTLRRGAATISGGLFMSVTGPGGVGPGGTASAGAYTVSVRSPSWISATSLEVIVDGVTTETIPLALQGSGIGKRYEATVNVAPGSSRARHWVVFHAKGDGELAPLHPKKKPFAVSNPIFFL